MVKELYENITISMMLEPRLVSAKEATVLCKVESTSSIFRYCLWHLWTGYLVCLAFTTLAMISGAYALYCNSLCYDTLFSRILTSTRHGRLDELFDFISREGDEWVAMVVKWRRKAGVLSLVQAYLFLTLHFELFQIERDLIFLSRNHWRCLSQLLLSIT